MVTIVIAPVGISNKKLSDIYFLGSFIDKDSPARALKKMDGFSPMPPTLPADSPSCNFGLKDIQPVLLAEGDNSIGIKRHYDFNPGRGICLGYTDTADRGRDLRPRPYILLSGPGGRPISPEILSMPELAGLIRELSRAIGNSGVLSFYEADMLLSVSQGGRIESAGIIKSAGPAAADAVMADYIKRCRLKPGSTERARDMSVRVKLVL